MVLLCREPTIRLSAAEQMLLIVTRATGETAHVKMMNTLLFTVINSLVAEHEQQSSEYFHLISRLLSFLSSHRKLLHFHVL